MTLSYRLFGEGAEKVIVLNDWSCDTSSYDPIHPFVDQGQFTFAFVDVRGYGKSIEQTGDFTAKEVSQDVAATADRLGWDRFHAIGHSMTGMVVQRIMVDFPARLKSVVATTPVAASGLKVDDDTFNFFYSMADDDEAFMQGMHALTSERYGEPWVRFKLQLNRATAAPDAMRAYCNMWGKTDFSDEVQGLKTPILVYFGAHDNPLLRKETLESVFKGWYPNLETHEGPCGHYPMQETPVEYAHVIQKFMAMDA